MGLRSIHSDLPDIELLVAQAETFCNGQVTRVIGLAQVRQKAAALADHHQQAPAAGLIVLVRGQVFIQVNDSLGQDGDLDFRGAGIAVVTVKIA
jgi:hypothetical protein